MTKKPPSLARQRDELFDQIGKLRNGTTTPKEANAVRRRVAGEVEQVRREYGLPKRKRK
jgi:hypothetical protein